MSLGALRILGLVMLRVSPQLWADDAAGSLPDGVKAVWDVTKAYHETTPIRERICLNGLYLDQPEECDDPYRFFCW